ncbi:MAG: serine hydrolase domain-containing protein [Gemmatimonadaceae bacterium]
MRLRVRHRHLAIALAAFLAACGERSVTGLPANSGRLAVSILGLPSVPSGAVSVSGSGTTYSITGTATFVLPVGTYTLSAAQAHIGGAPWYPNASSQTVTVTLGETQSARVRYGALPVGGAFVAHLDAFDSAMVAFMNARHVGAGTLTISRQGRVLYSRAFGWRDSARTQTLAPNALMRLASNSKPVTSAAIWTLVSQGHLALDTKAFALLALTPPGSVGDARINDITVKHLLDHTGGWNRSVAGDFMFKSRDISRALGISTPPSKTQIAQWAMTQPLQHAPGATVQYSNFGYLLLGLIVEKVTGQSFVDYVRQNLFTSAAASEVIAGKSLRADRDAREPFYADPYKGCSVFVIDTCVLVPWPDGGWYLESFDACGGLVTSAPAMASFLESYWISGAPRSTVGSASYTFYGSLDGTFTLTRQRPDGANLVALFNQRTDASGLAYEEIRQVLDAVADKALNAPLAVTD